MKTRMIMRVATVWVVALLSPIAAQAQPYRGGPEIRFGTNIDPALIRRAADLKVYKLQPPKLKSGMFGDLAGRLFPGGLRGKTVKADKAMAWSDDANPDNFMMLDTGSGLFSMSRGMAGQIDDKPGKLPDDAKAADLARTFLKQNDLGPRNDKEMVLAHIGRIRSRSYDPGKGVEGPIRDQMLTVNFSRLVDDTGIIGGASKMIVQIGDDGNVVGAGIRWRELGAGKLVGAKALRTPEQLRRDIQSFLTNELRLARQVDIRQLGLFYYDNGGDYLQPVIGYEAKVEMTNGPSSYFGQTALMLKPPERVGPEPVTKGMRAAVRKGPPETKPPTQKGD